MKKIAVTAGHSDKDPGAVANGYKESALAVKVRDRITDLLWATSGIAVLTDGKPGKNLPLSEAIKLCKEAQGRGVDIHFNAAENRNATGVEALCHPDKKLMAQTLCRAVQRVTGLKPRGGEGGYKSASSGQHAKLGFCEAGGIVLELGFISNPTDLNLIRDNMDSLATELAKALATW